MRKKGVVEHGRIQQVRNKNKKNLYLAQEKKGRVADDSLHWDPVEKRASRAAEPATENT